MDGSQGKTGLLVIDVQNDFMKGGTLAVGNEDPLVLVNQIKQLQDTYCFDQIIYTQDFHPQNHISFASNHADKEPFTTIEINGDTQELWPDHCVEGTFGAELHKDLQVQENDEIKIIKKGKLKDTDSYSGFGKQPEDTGLFQYLRNKSITKVFVVGLAYDFCVGNTAIDSDKNEIQTYIVEDLTRSVSENTKIQMNEKIQKSRISVINSEQMKNVQKQKTPQKTE